MSGGVADHVVIRQDVAVRGDEEARAHAARHGALLRRRLVLLLGLLLAVARALAAACSGMPGGWKSGPKKKRNSSKGSCGPLRTGTVAVVRMFTTAGSAFSTMDVKSGSIIAGPVVAVGAALAGVLSAAPPSMARRQQRRQAPAGRVTGHEARDVLGQSKRKTADG